LARELLALIVAKQIGNKQKGKRDYKCEYLAEHFYCVLPRKRLDAIPQHFFWRWHIDPCLTGQAAPGGLRFEYGKAVSKKEAAAGLPASSA
jgi:hypothetical protein